MIDERKVLEYASMYRKIAKKEINKKKYNSALDALYHGAAIQHKFHIQLIDKEAEEILSSLSASLLGQLECCSEDVIIFYDSIAISNMALSYQYLESLIATGRKIVYIVSKIDDNDDWSNDLFEIARGSSNCELIVIGKKKDFIWKINKIREVISIYAPKNIFLHMTNCDVWGCVAFSGITNANVFYINHGDEQFWLKPDSVSYVIEFRGMGVYTTTAYRGIENKQCIVNPYYPIIKNFSFNGFEFDIPSNSTIIFSGGRFFKIYSEGNIFLKVVKKILIDNPKAFYIFAGSGNSIPMKQFIKDNSLGTRWKVINYRKDLIGILKNVDIFLGTYPQSGGLMVQYAAAAGTPVVEMNTRNGGVAEDLLPKLKNTRITCDNWDDYFGMVKKLIDDEEFRKTSAQEIKDSLITRNEFIDNLVQIINQHRTQYEYEVRINNISLRTERLLEAENNYLHNVPRIMANKLVLRYYPFTAIKNLVLFILTKTDSKEEY